MMMMMIKVSQTAAKRVSGKFEPFVRGVGGGYYHQSSWKWWWLWWRWYHVDGDDYDYDYYYDDDANDCIMINFIRGLGGAYLLTTDRYENDCESLVNWKENKKNMNSCVF